MHNPKHQTPPSAHQILKAAMSKPYCGKTYYDFLEPEEIKMILSAMDEYAKIKVEAMQKIKEAKDE